MLKYHHKDQIRRTLQISSESAKGHNKTHNPIPNRRNLLYCAGPKQGVGIAVVIVLETLFFLFPLYIGLFQHSLFLIFLSFFIAGQVNML